MTFQHFKHYLFYPFLKVKLTNIRTQKVLSQKDKQIKQGYVPLQLPFTSQASV